MGGLSALIELLTPEPIGGCRYVGRPDPGLGWDAVYGGHLLGQATAVAHQALPDARAVHSLHGYFLKAGRAGQPIEYEVTPVRDGRSFSTRRVTACQDGQAIFEMLASFTGGEPGPAIAADPPADFGRLPAPDLLPRYPDLMARNDPLPFHERWAFADRGVDQRVVDAPWAPRGVSPAGGIRAWICADGAIEPDEPWLHAAILAYQSDDSISDNLLIPFDVTWSTPGTMVVSLDHSLWFHRTPRMDEWLFVEQWPVHAGGGRGLATGRVWSSDGQLVASFSQEALLRV
jgi:acyl-CoA thioesterase-2